MVIKYNIVLFCCIRLCFQNRIPSEPEIVKALDRFCPNTYDSDGSLPTKRIQNILKEEYRYLLHVFSLDRDKNVAEIIFKAIFTGRYFKK
jgi:hypothetical protein